MSVIVHLCHSLCVRETWKNGQKVKNTPLVVFGLLFCGLVVLCLTINKHKVCHL